MWRRWERGWAAHPCTQTLRTLARHKMSNFTRRRMFSEYPAARTARHSPATAGGSCRAGRATPRRPWGRARCRRRCEPGRGITHARRHRPPLRYSASRHRSQSPRCRSTNETGQHLWCWPVDVVGGGPSLPRTALTVEFPVSGKFTGKLRRLGHLPLRTPRGDPVAARFAGRTVNMDLQTEQGIYSGLTGKLFGFAGKALGCRPELEPC